MFFEKCELKVKTETIHSVECRDLESFIKEVTGHDYAPVPYEEWGNDSQHRFKVDGIMTNYMLEDWNTFKTSGQSENYLLRTILNGLCADGHIPAGIYLVCVCW